MFGQYGHFSGRDDKIEYAITRYRDESKRKLHPRERAGTLTHM
jgi:hypothetical protein